MIIIVEDCAINTLGCTKKEGHNIIAWRVQLHEETYLGCYNDSKDIKRIEKAWMAHLGMKVRNIERFQYTRVLSYEFISKMVKYISDWCANSPMLSIFCGFVDSFLT